MTKTLNYDVAVIGAGSAGIAAALASAKNGAKTVLVESSSVFGGDLISGLPIDGTRTTAGDWIVGGVAKELFNACDEYHGYVDSIYDRRNIYVTMINPKVMGFVIIRKLDEYGVDLLPYCQATKVCCENGIIDSITLSNKTEEIIVKANQYIDCTGDGDVAVMCGVPYEMGDEEGMVQPMTMVFQMRNVYPKQILQFVLDHPENCGLAENPNSPKTAKELAQELYDLGYPKVFFSSKGPLMKNGIESGELHSCSMLAFNVNSLDGSVITVNTTRLVRKDCTDAKALGESILELSRQVQNAFEFIVKHVPGCQDAILDGIAPRLGIRETRRILGEQYLVGEDAANGVRRSDCVAKGGHEIDVHGAGKNHLRKTIKDAGSYDIPYGCLIPKGMKNLLMAGRCISTDRIANSTARVMGTCMAEGQAVGTAAAMSLKKKINTNELSVEELRKVLIQQGAIV